MKNLSQILNGILAVAVIVLYILFFISKNKNEVTGKTESTGQNLNQAGNGIAYVNLDSVINRFDMSADVQNDLQLKLNTSQEQYNQKEGAYRKAVEDFQYKTSRQLVTRAEAEELQQKLAQQEQELYQLQNELRVQLNEEQQVAQRKILNAIIQYLEKNENNKGYQFILGESFGSNLLYGNKSLNISEDVIRGLNKEYSLSKAK